MQQLTTHTIALKPFIPRIAAGLAIICALSVFLYAFFLLEAVAHAARTTAIEREVRNLSGELSSLEATYLTKTATLTPQRAQALGFVKPIGVYSVVANNHHTALSFHVSEEKR